MHPLFRSLPVHFHELLPDAENLLLVALHDGAVSRSILSLGKIELIEGEQIMDAGLQFQTGLKDLKVPFGVSMFMAHPTRLVGTINVGIVLELERARDTLKIALEE